MGGEGADSAVHGAEETGGDDDFVLGGGGGDFDRGPGLWYRVWIRRRGKVVGLGSPIPSWRDEGGMKTEPLEGLGVVEGRRLASLDIADGHRDLRFCHSLNILTPSQSR